MRLGRLLVTSPLLVKWKKFTGIPPKSTNSLYDKNKHMWYKTYSYRLFREAMAQLLPNDNFLPKSHVDWEGHGLYIEAGIIEEFDLDNTLKGVIDALQEKYGFNDNVIKGLIARKKVVGKYPLTSSEYAEQYILIGLVKYDSADCAIFKTNDFKNVVSKETIKAPRHVSSLLFRAVSADWTNVANSSSSSSAVYPLSLYPDVENAAAALGLDVNLLVEKMKLVGPEYAFIDKLSDELELSDEDKNILKKELKNYIDANEYTSLEQELKSADYSLESYKE